jgi:zinc transporter ZupT
MSEHHKETRFSRRDFLLLGGIGVAGMASIAWPSVQQAPVQATALQHDHAMTLPMVQAPGAKNKLWTPKGLDLMELLTEFDVGKTKIENNQVVHEYEFVAVDKQIEVAPGVLYPAWTYNGRVPGPTIRVTEGDRVRIRFTLSLTAGLLIYLGFDATKEALEIADQVPGPFQGIGLIAIGIVLTLLLLNAVSRRQTAIGRSESEQRLALAYMIALGIGLHNLGEGLAIGAAYSIGELALGTFLVIGFIIQNITEGLGIIAPILRDRPTLWHLLMMGLLGGAPAIFGAWIGGFTYSAPLATLFLAIGAGAVFEVVYEIAKLIIKDSAKSPSPIGNFVGVAMGMLIMYLTGLFVK